MSAIASAQMDQMIELMRAMINVASSQAKNPALDAVQSKQVSGSGSGGVAAGVSDDVKGGGVGTGLAAGAKHKGGSGGAGGGGVAVKSSHAVSSRSTSPSSWASAMDEEEEQARVVMPERARGGSGAGEVCFIAEDVEGTFYKTYVRTDAVRALAKWIERMGVKVTRKWYLELALVSHTTATMPSAFENGRDKLRMLAKVGDAVLTLALSDDSYYTCRSVVDVQSSCASVLSGTNLSLISVNSGLARHVSFGANLDLVKSKPAGEALEAVVGVVYHSAGMAGVLVFLKSLGLIR